MAYKPIDPYRRANPPSMPGSERQWIMEELRKLEIALQALIAAIEELRKKVP